jgi:hypothetical protein
MWISSVDWSDVNYTRMTYDPMQLIPPLEFPRVRVSPILTMGCSVYLCWTLIFTADFSVYRTDFDSRLIRIPNLDTLILITDFCVWNEDHSGCDRSTGDTYSSYTPNPTSGISGGPCSPIYFSDVIFQDWSFHGILAILSSRLKSLAPQWHYTGRKEREREREREREKSVKKWGTPWENKGTRIGENVAIRVYDTPSHCNIACMHSCTL